MYLCTPRVLRWVKMGLIIYTIMAGLATYYAFKSGDISKEGEVKQVQGNLPTTWDALFIQYGSAHGIDWKILKRISYLESSLGLNPRVKKGLENPSDIEGSTSTDKKSWGLMQTTIATARDYEANITARDLNNPATSVRIASKHLARLKRSYSKFSERDLIMSYNHGEGNQMRFLEKEANKTLSVSEYVAGRTYYSKYLKAKELIP